MIEILAKSHVKDGKKVTLSKHTSDVLKVFENIKRKLNKINSADLIEAIEIAIFLHDLGKVLPSFQIKSLGNKHYKPWDIYHEIPHSLFSVFWVDKDKLKAKFNNENYLNFIISSIAYHHWRENFDDFISRHNEIFIKLCQKVMEEWGEILKENLSQEFSSFNEYKDFIGINKKWTESIINRRSFTNLAVPPYKFDYEPLRGEIKKEWILISGFLQRCDHFASWCEEEGENLNEVEIEPKRENEVKDVIGNKIRDYAWQFKVLDGKTDKNIILIAPTGYGKTEFAFLWGKGNKFFYTLPLRSAVNQIYERAGEIFGENTTGLLHSDADAYILEKGIDETNTMKSYELAKQLSYPVIISTGDQFFPYALRPPGYEKVFATLSYSRLVIDEVQAYDPKACAIITKFMEWIYKMGGKFLLMTATLPKFIENRIRSLVIDLEIVNIYEKEKENFQKIFKHKLKIKLIENKKEGKNPEFELPEGEIEEIIKKANEGKRVLVILNTVDFAQRVYEKLMNKTSSPLKDNIFLLHSRFTFEDRKNKENEYIKKFENPKPSTENIGKILVATQVVEASLNIDADVLFTEICPLDALVQRIGRVLRRYFYKDGKIRNKSDNTEYNISQSEFKSFENEPNVYMWVFKEGLQSGRKKVYSEELIKFSIVWLWKKGKGDIETLLKEISQVETGIKDYDESVVEKIFKEEFSLLLEDNLKEKSKKQKKESKENIYETILKDNKLLDKLNEIEIELSEYDKYALVTLFYSTIKRNGNYLKEFFDTLSLLDAGWMSERKSEAERIFREIYDVGVVPKNKLEEFKNEIEKFIDKINLNKKGWSLFTCFKTEVLSKYVLYLPRYSLSNNPILVYEIIKIKLDEKWAKRIEKWLSGIYLYQGEYNEELGLKV
ncbi:CRISPR-associated helicase/endonuclease Cas3 [Thermovenabulum gondwanense]|uniref:CRISPR-associated endonuclease/helicase Cas3 n=1 Tax=Thermovenabulum gondwanense TaxID=520767 RepID=A0A162MU31_9FIRM|nr:CRISPR-associated helicase/endonuclease Cas3 [Thermovenabulum gondwanense]KYO67338.1 CRISPR-associated endonuclease/helicase Cas3 [Thermovenabulum gondwanense]